MDFSDYGTEDFIMDETFQSYYFGLNGQDVAFWEQWIEDHPEKRDDITKAKQALDSITELYKAEAEKIPHGNYRQIRARLEERLARENTSARIHQMPRFRRYVWRGIAAAVVMLAMLLTYRYYFTRQDHTEYIVRFAPPGRRLDIQLSDGSKVRLNASGRITYPEKFSGSNRDVTLEGEAFFEVTKDPARPFKVTTGPIVTTVLGTSFNVASDSGYVQVALVTGRVKIENVPGHEELMLAPGEASFFAPGASLRKESFDPKEVLSWKEGVLYFKDADLQEMVRRLEQWYGIEIEIAGAEAHPKHLTGEFKDEPLDNVLNLLGYTRKFDYEIKGKKVTLKFKNQ
jgi:ferric-dicitrate binding protein FerR (iron transport regulator)